MPETEIAPTREAMSQVDRPLAVVNGVGTAGVAIWNVSVDHLNRPVLMTNATKVAMWTAVWQPWGGAHSITGTATLDTRFPGQWYQSETGLHYNWHRSYDPTIGRYTQPDPLGFVDGPSVYGYEGGMPQSAVDYDGLLRVTPNSPTSPIVRPFPVPSPPTAGPPSPVPFVPLPDNFNLPRTPQENQDWNEYKNFCNQPPRGGLTKLNRALSRISA
jgi:RHS repeat-associated protein